MTNETIEQEKRIQDYCDARGISVATFKIACALHVLDEQGKK